jgi:CRP/FNR family transcriptional regulator, cyclic AMP receptor protein
VAELAEGRMASLLELDPDLGQLLEGERLETARQELRVSSRSLQVGVWDTEKLAGASPDHVGLLLLDGVIAREVLISDIVSTELLGPGDIVRPWQLDTGDSLLEHSVRWTVLSRATAALLDRRFAAESARYPEIGAAIVDRVNERTFRLAVTKAISQLNRVDRRLLALFWHLAERWGRMTPDGVALPMTLSHRMLGQLIGARRPTVSTALSELARQREVVRRDDGTWLLTGSPVGLPEPEIERVIPMRRRLLPREIAVQAKPDPPPVVSLPAREPPLQPVHVSGVQLRAVLERLRAEAMSQLEQINASVELASRLAERSNELRARCREVRAGNQRRANA